jgi:hypothetical protein
MDTASSTDSGHTQSNVPNGLIVDVDSTLLLSAMVTAPDWRRANEKSLFVGMTTGDWG